MPATRPKGSPKTPGSGRKPGALNKNTRAIKDMVRQALDKAGGVAYLTRQAKENPGPFLTLVGKLMPAEIQAQIAGKDGGPVRLMIATAISRSPEDGQDPIPPAPTLLTSTAPVQTPPPAAPDRFASE